MRLPNHRKRLEVPLVSVSNMANTRTHAHVFKESDQRREFQAVSFYKRRSSQFIEKAERDLANVYKHTDTIISHEMKKVMQSQERINNRIEGLKQEKELPTKWGSLPRIDEGAEFWSVDPYPITFLSVAQPADGKKTFPQHRRKSLEFEDLPPLSYELTQSRLPAIKKMNGRSTTATANLHPVENTTPSITESDGQQVTDNATTSLNREPHGATTQSKSESDSQARVATETIGQLTKADKRTILNSPLSRRKLHSVIDSKHRVSSRNKNT